MSNQLQISGAAKIRTIQGPVVANSGVITALDGDASQYVRGDGTLADFPTSTGGGSSVSYYLNTSVSQGTIGGVAYKQLSKTPISGAGTDVTISADGYIASYITDANDPALLEVPAGNFNCEFYFSVNSNAHNPYVYAELYKYDGTTFTLLGSSQSIPEYLTNGTTLSAYYFAIPVATAVLTITDRIAVRIYVNVDTRTVTLHTENNHLCQIVTTFSKGLTTLNSLTRQVQFFGTGTSGTDFAIVSSVATHTFNLPVASAANTGKLSSTDWTTFNSKESVLTFSSPLVRTTNTISIPAATTSVNGYLTSTDWTTFDSKQGTITLTTTGTSGAATFSANTLNIPNYGSALSGYLPLTGGTLTGALGGTTATFTGTITASGAYSSSSDVSIIVSAAIPAINLRTPSSGRLTIATNYIAPDVSSILVGTGTNTPSTEAIRIAHSTGAITLVGALSGTSATFSGTITASGADLRANTGALVPVGVIISSNYDIISNPKTLYTSYGQSTILGGHEFRSVNGSGTGLITSLYISPSGASTFYYSLTANSFIKSGGTSSEFLKADGSIDSSTYLTTSSAASTYLPLAGGTLTGTLNSNSLIYTSLNFKTDSSVAFKNLTSGGNAPSSLAGYSQLFFDNYQIMIRKADNQAITIRYPSVVLSQTWDFNVEGYIAVQYLASQTTGGVSFVRSTGQFTQDATNFFWDDTNKRLGIGNATPSHPLDVTGIIKGSTSIYATNDLYIGDTTGSATGRLIITDSANQGVNIRRNNSVSERFKMFVGNGTTYTQDNCIILGINTDIDFYTGASPVKRLTIANSGAATFSSSVTATQGIFSSTSGNQLRIEYNSSFYWTLSRVAVDGRLAFVDNTNGEKVSITVGGNVGIGLSSPTSILHLSSTGRVFQWSGATTGIQYFDGANTGANLVWGMEGSAGGILYSGSSPYAAVFGNENNYPVQFGTNATTRMTITNAGIITTPYQVSFKAYISGSNPSLTKGVTSTIPYNNEQYDVQGNFNTSTYKFTAPVAGKYLFTVNINFYGVDDTAYILFRLVINSSSVRNLFTMANMPTGNTGDTNLSGSDILNLAAADTVEVRIYTDGSGSFSMSGGLDYNTFSGHLLG